MQLHQLKPNKSARQAKRRVGRGIAAGGGKTAGRGTKGQKSRQGTRKFTAGFEGGQVPMFRRMPRLRGFKNPTKTAYQVVNLSKLEATFKDGAKVDKAALVAHKLVAKMTEPVKILSVGDLSKKLEISVEGASQTAIKKIEKAGGKFTTTKVEKPKTERKKPIDRK